LILSFFSFVSTPFFILKWGVKKIHLVSVLASREGLSIIQDKHPDVYATIGMVDDGLTDGGILLPGMGDCGDRLFGTQFMTTQENEDDDSSLQVPVGKRKRSNSVEATETMKKIQQDYGGGATAEDTK
jgi:uracil phosphoribosyltransferase